MSTVLDGFSLRLGLNPAWPDGKRTRVFIETRIPFRDRRVFLPNRGAASIVLRLGVQAICLGDMMMLRRRERRAHPRLARKMGRQARACLPRRSMSEQFTVFITKHRWPFQKAAKTSASRPLDLVHGDISALSARNAGGALLLLFGRRCHPIHGWRPGSQEQCTAPSRNWMAETSRGPGVCIRTDTASSVGRFAPLIAMRYPNVISPRLAPQQNGVVAGSGGVHGALLNEGNLRSFGEACRGRSSS